jgi:hypothetical protein
VGRSSAAAGGGGDDVEGLRYVAFILISLFYAFHHVITKRLELKITVLKWLSMSTFIPGFF